MFFASPANGVGHEVESLPPVRSPDARSAGIKAADGVALSVHVSLNNVEPAEAVLT
jgi:hypothetical protein